VTDVLLVPGSLRAESVSSAVLRTAAGLAVDRIRATFYEGLGTLPGVNPDDDPNGGPVPAAGADVRRPLADAYAGLVCTPEYAGSLPGSFKSLLDWTVGGGETYGKPIAWINASSRPDPDAGSGAHAAQRTVLGYTGPADIAAAACRRIRVPRIALGTAVESFGLTSLVLPLRTLAVILVVVPAVVFVVAPALTRLFAGWLRADRPAAC
jgi:chromate reductase, NAD(P)H dehydrogenase (quinone)